MGIACGNAIILFVLYLSLFLLGKFNAEILIYLRYLGACYLISLAFQCFKALKIRCEIQPINDQNRVQTTIKSCSQNFILGLSSSLLNPKNIMFYSTLVILVYSKYTFVQNVLLCTWMVLLVLLWNLAIVKLLSLETYMIWMQRHIRYLYGISGTFFIFFAVVLII